ncbi:hypothetical protein [Tenacibaculum sp. M341]|uniref:hypothetical protein n=1 Tax=Tenacibaculum sp. M341 TaxID=2530339 RepID=UPI00104D90D4|nr:hypothetical protein [Tenacibaculum sp. M341]TCI93667.1 hypothetical protein EYW44_04435 [Tenacibaculum sp. M341]
MRRINIETRLSELRNAIAYSRNEGKIMSIGEGICCNQEIAAWLRVLEDEHMEPKYVVSESINEKITTINNCIDKENWVRPEII